jgi:hypothetical protein
MLANATVADYLEPIRERVHDPKLAELLCPTDHRYGTKRATFETKYYDDALNCGTCMSLTHRPRRSCRLPRRVLAAPAAWRQALRDHRSPRWRVPQAISPAIEHAGKQ